jgi:GntR family transcriptional regulator
MKKSKNNQESPLQKIYVQAQQKLLEMIKGPEFSVGDKIPSERKLSMILKVSRMTIRKAISLLIEDGVLERHGTSGTFLTVPRIYRPIDPQLSYSISEIVGSKGDIAGSILLFFELTHANSRLARRLAIEEGEETIVIRRLRTVNKIPFCIETSHIPATLTPELSATDIVNAPSLYTLLKEKYDLEPVHGEGLVSIAKVTHREAELLGMNKKDVALVYRTLVFDKEQRPMEYLVSVNHPQQVIFKTVHGETIW